MLKRPLPSCRRSPHRSHRSMLVSPLASSTRLTPNHNVECAYMLFSTPVVLISDIKGNHINAVCYSHAQHAKYQAYDA